MNTSSPSDGPSTSTVSEFVYADAASLQAVLSQVFAAAYDTPDANLLSRSRLAVAFVFTAPDLQVLIDGRDGERVLTTFGVPLGQPDLIFRLGGTAIHPFWSGALNIMTALGTGKLQLQGSLISALKIAPMMPMMQATYRRVWGEQHGSV